MRHVISFIFPEVDLDAVLSPFCERVNAIARMCHCHTDMQHSSLIKSVCCYGEKMQFDVILSLASRLFLILFSPPLLIQFDLREESHREARAERTSGT